MSNILITGATGQLGKAVVNQLLLKINPSDINVLVRDVSKAQDFKEKGVNIIKGDYKDYESLVNGFMGIDKLYFISSSELKGRFYQHENVVNAAREANVEHIVYTSAQRKSEDGSSPIASVGDAHWQTDNAILESGLMYTILKHPLYTDILPMLMGSNVLESGTIFLPAGNGKTSYASRNDLAAAGAIILTEQGHENKVYELGGQRSYSFEEIAGILTQLSGKQISYISPEPEVFISQLKNSGLPNELIEGAASFCIAISQDEFDFPATDLKSILGREPQSVADFLKAAYQIS